MWNKFLANPYVLAILAGTFPIIFYLSNNWYIFTTSRILFIVGAFSLLIFLSLATYYLLLSWVFRKLFRNNAPWLVQQCFVLGSILTLIYLLRQTFQEFSDNGIYFALIIILISMGLGWVSPKNQILHLNTILMILCTMNVGSGLYSMLNATETTSFINKGEDRVRQKVYDQVRFQKKPNVYYIVPDGYPNQQGLKEIFGLDNAKMYQQLESLGFSIHHFALSNYRSTLSSISSLLGMQHHYYQGSIGNFELLYSREYIVSEKNPVVRIFKTNGYQVHYVHEKNLMFAKGCFIDFCSPNYFMDDFLDILIPQNLHAIPFIAKAMGRLHDESLERILNHIDELSTFPMNYFTYIHLSSPDHSPPSKQTRESLASFRKKFLKKIEVANEKITKIIDSILTRDPGALIILNADHGGWGLGAYKYAQMEIFEGVPAELITLDHLGVLLAIRWPENNVPEYERDIRTNINLFRYIFAYLSESQDILTTKVPDDGFLTKGKDGILMKVVNDGKILERMIEMGPLK